MSRKDLTHLRLSGPSRSGAPSESAASKTQRVIECSANEGSQSQGAIPPAGN